MKTWKLDQLKFKTSPLVSAVITFESEVDDAVVTIKDIKKLIDLLEAQKSSFEESDVSR